MQTESPTLTTPLIALDTEVTGTGASARVVQIGAVVLDSDNEFVRLVSPDTRLTAEARARTGLTDTRLASAPGPHKVFADLMDWIEATVGYEFILVAHNAHFDARAIASTLAAAGPVPSEHHSAVSLLSAKLTDSMNYFRNRRDFAGTLGLDALHLRLIGVPIANRAPYHDALVDARALAAILKRQKDLSKLRAAAHPLEALGRLKPKRRKPVEMKFETLDAMLEFRCEQQKILDELEAEQDHLSTDYEMAAAEVSAEKSRRMDKLRETEEFQKLWEERHELNMRIALKIRDAMRDPEMPQTHLEISKSICDLNEKIAEVKSKIRRVETRIGHLNFADQTHFGYTIRRAVNPKSFLRMEQLEMFLGGGTYAELVRHFDKAGIETLPVE